MKKIFIYLFIILVATSLFACGSNKNEENTTKELSAETYQCPMDCENGKTYTKPGQCAVCEMDLEKTSSI